MNLVEQVQDDTDALVIHTDIVPQVTDEPGAGKIEKKRSPWNR